MRTAPQQTPPGKARTDPGQRAWSRGEVVVLAALVALSLLLHVTYVLQSRASPLFDQPQMDALYHVEWARAVAAGAEFQEGPFFRAPLYPWFLGGLFALFGEDLLLVRLVQSCLGAASTLLVYLLGRRAFGRPAAALAGLLSATYWVSIFYDAELLLEALATPLYLLGLYLTLGLADCRASRACAPSPHRGVHRGVHRGLALCAGLVWGLAVITRPNALLFVPLLLAWIPWVGVGSWKERMLPALAFGLGVLLPILPITAYNASQGDRVLISSQAGVNLWIGNNPQADGHTAIVPGTRPDWWGGYEDAISAAERAEGRELRPSEVSRHYTGRALEFARSQPAAWAGQMLWKLRLFWMDWELGNNEEPRFLARRFSSLMRWLPTSFGMLAALALVGIVAGRTRAAGTFPLWGFLVIFTLSVVLFFVNARFRLPVLPVLMVYAGHGLETLWDRGRSGRWPSFLGFAGLGLAAFVGSLQVPALLRVETEANGFLRLGQAQARGGRPAEALVHFERALEIYTEYAPGAVAPGSPAGERPAGPGSFPRVVALGVHAAWMDLGRERFERAEYGAAAESFEQALAHSPRSFEAAFSLGKSLLPMGETTRARAAFELALEGREPDDPAFLLEAYREAARLAAEAGDHAEALALSERMVQRFPEDPRAVELLRRLRARGGR